ncbi:MAG: glycosyltransferase family 2 protein [Bacteroidales bacterium]|nr:glycosyltransferase family 2 protein [Bacteroidales bacterium]
MSTDNLSEADSLPYLYVALPVMNEPELLAQTLSCIDSQTYRHFKVFICVNQPEHWWEDPSKAEFCKNNLRSIDLLKSIVEFEVIILDRATKGNGWKGKQHGVGHARRIIMEEINKVASPDDVIISLDADTTFSDRYFLSVAHSFSKNQHIVALCNPYFHKEVNDEKTNRAMLHYEIYMRHYFLQMDRIGSPYSFTALGSAMSFPVWAYRAIGGMTPKMSGEDFYFLQKLRKFGTVLLWNDELVYPAARFSDRVFFGTGPAMIKGACGDWTSYPVYSNFFFNEILETYLLLPLLYFQTFNTKITRFLSAIFDLEDPYQCLRENNKDMDHFIRAFHEKFDGLRILQYLKTENSRIFSNDEENLKSFLDLYYPEMKKKLKINWNTFSFSKSPVAELTKIRGFFFEKEMEQRFISILP